MSSQEEKIFSFKQKKIKFYTVRSSIICDADILMADTKLYPEERTKYGLPKDSSLLTAVRRDLNQTHITEHIKSIM